MTDPVPDAPVPDAPTLTRLLEAMTDYLQELADQLPTISDSERPASRVMAEYHRLSDLYDFLEVEASLCLVQDPRISQVSDVSWKCQLWAGHRQSHSYS